MNPDTPHLSRQDWYIIVDFENSTGESEEEHTE
ncbi:hypothetical protein BMS3Abin16_00896 [archaeon BMS3Abin16]|nr:hypothetical protein BMS3Abin16_00896 [archaeon BMS3Abin16]